MALEITKNLNTFFLKIYWLQRRTRFILKYASNHYKNIRKRILRPQYVEIEETLFPKIGVLEFFSISHVLEFFNLVGNIYTNTHDFSQQQFSTHLKNWWFHGRGTSTATTSITITNTTNVYVSLSRRIFFRWVSNHNDSK